MKIGRSVMESVLVALVCFCVTWCQAADEGAPSIRPLSDEDFAAGIVLTKIGTGEDFDFSAPDGAVVCADWEAFGAARDWFRLGFGAEDDIDEDASEGWSLAMGTNRVDSFTVFSYGTVRPSVTNVNTCISPLNAVIGIVPASNHGLLEAANRPSRFWHCLTPSNTVQLTWQNVLLDREVSKPVSFQVEIDKLGNIAFRYDLSRLSEEAIVNLSAGVMNEGRGRMFSYLSRDITSLQWRYLDPSSTNVFDHDGDGIATDDELFVYDTDPYSADTDRDGLSDYEEVAVANTNPNARYSSDPRVPDSVASALDGTDPYSCPNGDGRSAFENVFYTGSPSGRGGEPVSDRSTAVLKVSAVGSGRGVLMVGDKMVPLLPGVNPLKVAVPRGARIKLKYEPEGELHLNYDSPDFCIGEPPYGVKKRGWIAFPYTEASHPCLHVLDEDVVIVSLEPGADIEDLTCTWSTDGGAADVVNVPPLSATVTARFSRKATAQISYRLSHPDYLFGAAVFRQTCEYCPKIEDEPGYSSTEDYPNEQLDSAEFKDESWCEEHCCYYWNCRYKHELELYSRSVLVDESVTNDYRTAVNSPKQYTDILKLHRPYAESENRNIRLIDVVVPKDKYQCCQCKDHWESCASIGFKSRHVAVHNGGEPFTRTTTNCTLSVYGVSPSEEIGDSRVSILTNGAVYVEFEYTVFGVSILGDGVDLGRLNRLNSSFGMPVVINTNLNRAVNIRLCTDVNLSDGVVRLAFENPKARMQLWMTYTIGDYYGHEQHLLLLDSKTRPELELSITEWKRLVRSATFGRETTLQLLAYDTGSVNLVFGYAGGKDGKYLHDEAVQTITAIRPPLLPDYNRDGRIDDEDAKLARDNRFYFWTNNDHWKNDLAFSESYYAKLKEVIRGNNGGDDMVNGRNDLVNQLPLAIYVTDLWEPWKSNNVKFKIRANVDNTYVRRCYADTSWDAAKASVLEDIEIEDESHFWQLSYGGKLCDAKMTEVEPEGEELSVARLSRCIEHKGMIYLEAVKECVNPVQIEVVVDNEVLYKYTPQLCFSDVEKMYRWHNIRRFADKSGVTAVGADSFQALPSPAGWPDDERDDANFYFVHGYNVSEQEARDWGQAFFKRMWWSGMNAKFHVVTWFGNETQKDLPIAGLVSPNYHVNVENAFASSKAFVELVKKYPGKNYVAAHSLGNMLVSSAIQDWNLPYERYFMINAAVAAEAYDTSAITDKTTCGMTPRNWNAVPLKYRSTHWFELEDFDQNDARRQLTWRNRFNNIDKTVNYYSPEEEVLKCDPDGDGKRKLQRDWSWYNQERIKGGNPVPGSRSEGGWVYNPKYQKEEHGGDPTHGGTTTVSRDPFVSEILNITEDLRCHPVFKPFEDISLMTDSLVPNISRGMVSQLLADAIPAESFPAGFNEVPKWKVLNVGAENINMAEKFKTNGEIYFWWWEDDWGHSFFLDAPYMVVHGLFEDMKGRMK